jgi:hypothetical protein
MDSFHDRFETAGSGETSSPFAIARSEAALANTDDVTEAAHMYQTTRSSPQISVQRYGFSLLSYDSPAGKKLAW